MPKLVWKFSTFKLRWFPLFGVFTPLNVWKGQPCDYSASCSVLPAFRMCTHHYTSCVGIPIFRHQSYPDKGRLIQKSPVCWDYVPEMGFARGKGWAWLHPSAAGKTHCSGSNAQHCAIDEFRESWGEDMARDLELIPIDILLVTRVFIMKNSEIMTLIIIGSNISGTSGRLHTFPSSFKHYAAHGFWTGQLHWETTILELSVEARYSKRNPGPPSLSQRDVEALLWLWNLVIGNPAFTVDFPIETLGFHGQATLLEDVHVRSWIIDDHNMT